MNREIIDFSDLLEALDAIEIDSSSLPTAALSSDDEDRKSDIISALDRVVTASKRSGLGQAFWDEVQADMNFLRRKLDMPAKEILIVGVLAEMGTFVTWDVFGRFLGLSRLRAMSMTSEVEELKNKRWIRSYKGRMVLDEGSGFGLAAGVVGALRNNEVFVPEKLDGLEEHEFIDRLVRFLKEEGSDMSLPLKDKCQWLDEFCSVNNHLALCTTYSKLKEWSSRILLLLAVNDFMNYGGTHSYGLGMRDIDDWFESGSEKSILKAELNHGTQELFGLGIIEFGTDDGLADINRWQLTTKAREELLAEVKPRYASSSIIKRNDRDLHSHKDILKKDLFYSQEEVVQIGRIQNILSKDGYDNVKQRLAESGFRTGICCLLYGAPGTGKTETVLQLARGSERDIFQVNISEIRDKYVGESEKNIKMVFERYRKLCRGCDSYPILFFNEADAILGRRFENVSSSVEKMDNALQNIILQEMETFEGILIATTNLTDNLDTAFDRRFLFKVEFKRPEIEARKRIWHTMLPELGEDDCKVLAGDFDLSGGQIENVARKCKIEYIVAGSYPDMEKVCSFCKEEYLNRRNSPKRIGF